MMLHDKGAMKSKRLGFDVVFDEIAKPLGAVELSAAAARSGAAEQSEPHGTGLPSSFAPEVRRCAAMFQMLPFVGWQRAG
jgi:hypothetical protein